MRAACRRGWLRSSTAGPRPAWPPAWSAAAPGVVLGPRRRRRQLQSAHHAGYRLPDRLPHQDLHRHRRDAAMRAGTGGTGCARQRLPAFLPAGPGQGQLPARDRAAPAHPHRRCWLLAAALRPAAARRRLGRPGRTIGCAAAGRVLPQGPASGGRAGHQVGLQQPRVRRPGPDRRGHQRPAPRRVSARAHLRAAGHGAHRPDPVRTGPAPGHRVCAALGWPQAGRRPRSANSG